MAHESTYTAPDRRKKHGRLLARRLLARPSYGINDCIARKEYTLRISTFLQLL
jgi:hypothetical protein